jgi:hypothetical protein
MYKTESQQSSNTKTCSRIVNHDDSLVTIFFFCFSFEKFLNVSQNLPILWPQEDFWEPYKLCYFQKATLLIFCS